MKFKVVYYPLTVAAKERPMSGKRFNYVSVYVVYLTKELSRTQVVSKESPSPGDNKSVLFCFIYWSMRRYMVLNMESTRQN